MGRERHLGWSGLGSGERTMCGSVHIGIRFVASPGEVAPQYSTAVTQLEGRWSRERKRKERLLKHRMLDSEVLHRHSLVQRPDEERGKLRPGWAEAGLECEARDEASSCHAADHGFPHLEEHWGSQIQNELGTDLQWGWADTAAGGAAAAGHMLRRGSLVGAAGHRRRTWAGAGRRRARQCGQERKPVSARTRA